VFCWPSNATVALNRTRPVPHKIPTARAVVVISIMDPVVVEGVILIEDQVAEAAAVAVIRTEDVMMAMGEAGMDMAMEEAPLSKPMLTTKEGKERPGVLVDGNDVSSS